MLAYLLQLTFTAERGWHWRMTGCPSAAWHWSLDLYSSRLHVVYYVQITGKLKGRAGAPPPPSFRVDWKKVWNTYVHTLHLGIVSQPDFYVVPSVRQMYGNLTDMINC